LLDASVKRDTKKGALRSAFFSSVTLILVLL
jgi:hypothetical protein